MFSIFINMNQKFISFQNIIHTSFLHILKIQISFKSLDHRKFILKIFLNMSGQLNLVNFKVVMFLLLLHWAYRLFTPMCPSIFSVISMGTSPLLVFRPKQSLPIYPMYMLVPVSMCLYHPIPNILCAADTLVMLPTHMISSMHMYCLHQSLHLCCFQYLSDLDRVRSCFFFLIGLTGCSLHCILPSFP